MYIYCIFLLICCINFGDSLIHVKNFVVMSKYVEKLQAKKVKRKKIFWTCVCVKKI